MKAPAGSAGNHSVPAAMITRHPHSPAPAAEAPCCPAGAATGSARDAGWLARHVRQLTALHESGREQPWAMDDAPEKFIAGQLRTIVGVELVVTRLEAKEKLSQNRSAADAEGVAAGLRALGREASAAAVERARS